ncbi:MAG: 3-isopropylmalate dehydratase small subunit [Bacteroidales bacterium OttesenSCG-928-I14]|jgi:3-isopropylmalate/(R)-2-methylmalate dehydratase small subunit|nr:3-isopropylmalate dehydratase small subunit [Bacteroidales bacterium OttesenSCG-928-I14]
MEKFVTLTSTVVPLPIQNIDTDQIIPARFLKSISRENFGKKLFYDWRYDNNGRLISSFVLNDAFHKKSKILVVGENFGSGSSREHAVWAIADYGFKVIISSFFADIFKNNAMNNFVLPIVVSKDFLSKIFVSINQDSKMTLTVDLKNQLIINNFTKQSKNFVIKPFKKECFLNGFDNIDYLLSKKNKIIEYEHRCEY